MDNLIPELEYILSDVLKVDLPMGSGSTNLGQRNENLNEALQSLNFDSYKKMIQRYKDDFELFDFEIPKFDNLLEFFNKWLQKKVVKF